MIFLGVLGPPYCGIGATIRIGREMLFLPYAGFFLNILLQENICLSHSCLCLYTSLKSSDAILNCVAGAVVHTPSKLIN